MLTRTTSRVMGRAGRWVGRGPRGADLRSPVWPMAVGVVVAPEGFTGRTRAEDRLALALGAYRRGFFLLDLVDVPAARSTEWGQAWAPVWALVERTVADAVLVYAHDGVRPLPSLPAGQRRVPVRMLPPEH